MATYLIELFDTHGMFGERCGCVCLCLLGLCCWFWCVCSVVLCGCTSSRFTTSDGNPYTPNDVKEMVEERFKAYNPRLVLQSSRVVSRKPNKHNEYTF